ncbi:MAG: hypothetical protein JWM68_3539 [Verrucomicrobiales bacterium]|nr:hypothetical protein [Verrucomicrobiales bacterium]
MIDHEPDERAKSHFRWKAALWAGLGVGAIFIFLSRGIPWSSMGFGTSAMGRELPINSTPTYFIVNSFVHMLLSVIYAFVIGRVVFRFDIATAVVTGAILGVVLYGLNFMVFHYGFGLGDANEFPVAANHFFFGMMSAAAYKAFSVPRVQEQPPANP